MDKETVEARLLGILDTLGAIEHERWSYWQRYMHSRATLQNDGSMLLPAHLVEQWERQIATPYNALSEQEKESDREQVRRYLPTIIEALSNHG